MASSNVLTLTDSNFDQEVLQSSQPVLVDFWTTWCPPCKMIAPIIDEIADEKAGIAKVGKVDVTEENQALASKFQIKHVPTFLVFKDGELKEKFNANTKRELLAKLEAHA